MINVKTDSGFSCKVNEEKIDDMKFLKLLREMEKSTYLIDDVARVMIGDENTDKLYEHLEQEDGRVPTSLFITTVLEIMEKAGQKSKKS